MIFSFSFLIQKGRQDPRCKELEFMDLLVLPIQRIPRYVMLLEVTIRQSLTTTKIQSENILHNDMVQIFWFEISIGLAPSHSEIPQRL